jgi:hypothetical protein
MVCREANPYPFDQGTCARLSPLRSIYRVQAQFRFRYPTPMYETLSSYGYADFRDVLRDMDTIGWVVQDG